MTPIARPPTRTAPAAPALPIVRQLLHRVIRPTLARLAEADPGIDGEAAEMLMLGTAAVESGFRAIAQVGGGPALGLWQVEPATHDDVWRNWLAHRPALARAVASLRADVPEDPVDQLATTLPYGCAIARLVYRRSPLRLTEPAEVPIVTAARLWKRGYNTAAGAGTEAKYRDAWDRLVVPNL
jgi:hypothetical protein